MLFLFVSYIYHYIRVAKENAAVPCNGIEGERELSLDCSWKAPLLLTLIAVLTAECGQLPVELR